MPPPRFAILACSLFALAATASVSAAAGKRRALLVGVDHYPEQYGWPALAGPVADVELVRTALLARGFESRDIVVLRNQEAKRLAILDQLEKLAAVSTREDLIFFYFAGHGSRLPDEGNDELDPYDETIVPYDAGEPPLKANDIRDDAIGAWIARANQRTDQVVLVFDCCSSGTNTRGGDGNRFLDRKALEPRARGFDAPRASLAPEAPAPSTAAKPGSGYTPAGRRFVALSACRSNESAYELQLPDAPEAAGSNRFAWHCAVLPFLVPAKRAPIIHGAFTWRFVQALQTLGDEATYADVLARVSSGLRPPEGRQTPVIEGPLGAYRLFTSEAAQDARHFPLERLEDGTWRLAAGRLEGLTEGALFAVGPAGARHDALAQRLGRVRIVRAGREASLVRWVGDDGESDLAVESSPTTSADAPAEKGEAFLLEPGRGGLRLGFALSAEGPAAVELERRLTATNLLVRSEATDADFLIVREAGPTRERWRVQSRRGRPLPLSASLSSQEELDHLIDDLARLALARRARALLEGDATDELAVDFAARALAGNIEEAHALAEREDGALVVPPKERLVLEMKNTSSFALSAAVLWFSPDGEVSWVGGTTEEESVEPGQVLRLELDELALPAGREDFFREAPLELVCIASSRWHDYTPLFQDPVGGSKTRGGGSKDESDPLACEGWTTRVLRLALAPAAR